MSPHPVRTLLAAALLAFAACGTPQENPPSPNDHTTTTNHGSYQDLKSDQGRSTPDAQAKADAVTLAQDNTAFAFDLYQRLRSQSGNLFFSPYSISSALAMTYGGARTSTQSEMASALHFTLPQDRLHPAFNALDQELQSRATQALTDDKRGFTLHVVDSIWGQKDHAFLPAFLDLLAENYGAGLRLLDFRTAPETARQTINGWVSDETNARIPELIPAGDIDTSTLLVLVDAVYFNAAWATPFDPADTQPGPFHALDGSTPTVPMMALTHDMSYGAGDGWKAVAIPYEGDQLTMVVVVPDEGRFADVESSFSAAAYQQVLASLQPALVDLKMPKFSFSSRPDGLTGALEDLGMIHAFHYPDADFSGMDGQRILYISKVDHEGFVKVDESGTEATAATAVVMNGGAAPPSERVSLTIDRPCLFFIQDLSSGTVLFFGRLVNPS